MQNALRALYPCDTSFSYREPFIVVW